MVSISFRSDRSAISILFVFIFSICFFLPNHLFGFHGLFLPAYGARQAGMGGAFLGMGGSVMDLQNNPSGLAKLETAMFEAGAALNRATIDYNDRTYFAADNTYFENNNRFHPVSPLPYFGYATPVSDDFAFGIALYAQGGGGGDLDGLVRRAGGETTSSGDVDTNAFITEDLQFRFLHAKLTAGGAYSIGRLRLGAAFDLSMAFNNVDRTLTVLPVSLGSHPVSYLQAPGGFHYRSDPAYAPSGKVGVGYDIGNWSVAYSYSADSQLKLDGMMRVDSTDLLRQGSSRTKRTLAWPDRHSAGVSFKGSSFNINLDLHYIPWSKYFNRMVFAMDRPMVATPFGPVLPALIWNLRWRDQLVSALGFEYRNGNFSYRAGTSYGQTPLKPEGLNPFLGSTTEYHFSVGFGYDFSDVSLDIAFEYAPGKRINGSPFSDWAISREVQGALFQFSRVTTTRGVYLGLRYRL